MVKHSRLERDWAARVLHSLVTDSQTRLRQGRKLRDAMVAAIEKGETPTGYRPMWIKQSAHRAIALLHQISGEFNDSHSTDQVSIPDLLDILATAAKLLQNAQEEISPEQATESERPKFLA
jgi:hypothetical protein